MFEFITNLFHKKPVAPVAETPYKIEAPQQEKIAPKVNPVKASKKKPAAADKPARKPRAKKTAE